MDVLHSAARRLRKLRAPPRDAHRLLQLTTDEEVDIERFCAEIETSPPLAARVVGMAGAAYFGSPVPVRSVKDAVVRVLGLDLVKSIVMGIAVADAFTVPPRSAFDMRRYWTSALITAGFARALARLLGGEPPDALARWPQMSGGQLEPETAYLCGLLHNIGLLALMAIEPAGMEAVLRRAAARPGCPLRPIEQELLHTDHCEIGALLAERWRLPEEVAIVILRMHDLDYVGPAWPLAAAISLGAQRARARSAADRDLVAGVGSVRLGLSRDQLLALDAEFSASVEETEALAGLLAGPG